MSPQTEAFIAVVASVAGVAIAATSSLNNATVAYIGIPLTALAMAAFGAAMSYAFGEIERNRRRLFGITITSTMFGAALVTAVPAIFGWTLDPVAQGPFAFIFALFARWIIPALKSALPSMAKALVGLIGRNNGGYQGPYEGPPYEPPQYRHPQDDDDRGPPHSGGY